MSQMDDYKPRVDDEADADADADADDYAYDIHHDDTRKRSQLDNHSDPKKRKTQQSTPRLNKDGSEKPKLSRGSRACLVCRRVKMRCIGASEGVKCKRCFNGGHECIFEESNRGRRSTKKPDHLANSLSSMSETVDGVLRTFNPGTPQSDNSQYSSAEASTSKLPHNGRPTLNRHSINSLEKLMSGSRAQQLEAAAWLMQFQESILSYNNQILDQNERMVQLHNKQPHIHGNSVTPLDQLVNAFQVSSPGMAHKNDTTNANGINNANNPTNTTNAERTPQHHERPASPKLHSLPDDTLNPLGLLAEASLNNRRYSARNSQRPDLQTILNNEETDGSSPNVCEKEKNEQVEAMLRDQKSEGIGVASDEYYTPGPMSMLPLRRIFIERQVKPEILNFCSDQDISNLFHIYYKYMNLHTCVLDEGFHTPSLVASRSPFLLTAVCAVASKFYTQMPHLQPKLQKVARKLAFDVPSRGFKSVEIVMGYLVLVYWGIGPSRRFEEDKTWLLLGLALRVATDLNLHKKASAQSMPGSDDAQRERELRCRERVWILCYITDRSLSAQMGKPPSTSHREDYIIRHVSDWARNEMSNPEDYRVAAYCEMQRIVSRCIDFLYSASTPSGLGADLNYMLITVMFESQLVEWIEKVLHNNSRIQGSAEQHAYIISISKFMFNYWSLAVFSFGLQSSLETSNVDTPYFFAKCYHFAMELLSITKKELGPNGWLKYSVDSHFVFITYAAVSLLKFMRPQFSPYHAAIGIDNTMITGQVSEIANLLAGVAVDARHTPALYAAFLQALIGPPTTEEDDGGFRNRNEIFDRLVGDQGKNSMTDLIDESVAFMPPPHQPPVNSQTHPQPHTPQLDEYAQAQAAFEGTSGDYMSMDLKTINEQAQAMDALYQNGFWENVLLPGFGGPLDSISGGVMRSGFLTPKGITPSQTPRNISRPQTPANASTSMSQQYSRPRQPVSTHGQVNNQVFSHSQNHSYNQHAHNI
ncbi:hypothetical protein E3P86_02053 [Wallemia ichthyophaga]|uniref:Zn(2)-C6 fungal-type domain-containing protein n=1 Tax=Wallemia ichthyophaga TaxID=245174 RepID=A0A4T0J8F5_WALIC|nr:hypothetical protein E3P86_02053 [Wallemia ichthyophaga]